MVRYYEVFGPVRPQGKLPSYEVAERFWPRLEMAKARAFMMGNGVCFECGFPGYTHILDVGDFQDLPEFWKGLYD